MKFGTHLALPAGVLLLCSLIVKYQGIAQAVEWRATRRRNKIVDGNLPSRALDVGDDSYASIVSGIRDNVEWCIAVTNGVNVGARVGFRVCDSSDDQQKWKLQDNKWASKVNTARCMTVESGKTSDIKVGARIRIADCSTATSFTFSADGTKSLMKVKSNTKYCVTNQGQNPDSTDPMLLELCAATAKKQYFTFKTLLEYDGYATDTTPSGCLVVKGENAVAGQPLVLGSCDLNHRWRLDSAGLFHTELNDAMCMQAAPASGEGIVQGVRMVVNPCNAKNPYQIFVQNPGIRLQVKGYDNLCVGFQGVTPNIGTDRIVLEYCETGEAWSWD